jgi:4-hydroxy-3-polyprenylbenzoate decarboxylase
MGDQDHKIVIGITGASGAIYAQILIEKLIEANDQIGEVGVVMSKNAQSVWEHELGNNDYKKFPFPLYAKNDFNAPFASGSAQYNTLIVCPCSMGTMGRIASGLSDDLLTRAADVILKEKRKLILVARETPLSLIHIENMRAITNAGGIICPATPSFYSRPTNIHELAATVIDRVIDLCGIQTRSFRWKQN